MPPRCQLDSCAVTKPRCASVSRPNFRACAQSLAAILSFDHVDIGARCAHSTRVLVCPEAYCVCFRDNFVRFLARRPRARAKCAFHRCVLVPWHCAASRSISCALADAPLFPILFRDVLLFCAFVSLRVRAGAASGGRNVADSAAVALTRTSACPALSPALPSSECTRVHSTMTLAC